MAAAERDGSGPGSTAARQLEQVRGSLGPLGLGLGLGL